MTLMATNEDVQLVLERITLPENQRSYKNIETEYHALNHLLKIFTKCSIHPLSIIALSFAINIANLIPPLVILKIIDISNQDNQINTVYFLVVGLLFVIIAEACLRLARSQLLSDFALKQCYRHQMRAGRRLLNRSCSVNARLSPAETTASLGAIDALYPFSGGSAQLAILDLPFIFLFLGVIWFIGGVIVAVPIILIAGLAIWTLRSHAANKPIIRDLTDRQQQYFCFYAKCIKGLATIKALAVEPQMQRRFERMIRSTAPTHHAHILHSSRVVLAGQIFTSLTLIAVITVGGVMTGNGIMSIGALTACLLLSYHVTQMVLRCLESWDQFESAGLALEKSQAIINLPQRPFDIKLVLQPAKVQLNGISIGDAGQRGKYSGVHLTISPGETVGIIIRDDLQRKAMARLLRGQITPDHGEIRIDGMDPSDENCDAALRGMLLVDENPTIFHGTVVENMSMFGSINPAAAIELAQRLGVEADIKGLPEAYQTQLKDIRAFKLSSDLLLAITLVRAAAIRPAVFILDIRSGLSASICARALNGLIRELRGSSTIIILGRELTDLSADGRNYIMHDWSLEAIAPMQPGEDDANKPWEDIPNG